MSAWLALGAILVFASTPLAQARTIFIGDSLSMTDGIGLGETLHRHLSEGGEHVDSYGSCGSSPKDWVAKTAPKDCGSYVQQGNAPAPHLSGEKPAQTPSLAAILSG